MAKLIKIYSRPQRRADTISIPEATLLSGTGIEGDHFKSGKRQVTIMSQKVWQDICQELNQNLDPKIRRSNLLVDDIDLKNSIGKIITVGSVKIRVAGETTPCRLMDEAVPGLKNALIPDWRGGAFGEIITPGKIQVGDAVSITCCDQPIISAILLPKETLYTCGNCKKQFDE
jgi:MOSC domain-containing protein YiiM